MKNLKFILWAALAATFVTSCTGDDEANNGGEPPVEVKFAAENLARVETRVTDATWAQGDGIGVFMIKDDPGTLAAANILEGADNIRYNSAGGSGTVAFSIHEASQKIFYPTVSGNVKFTAYYPHQTPLTDYKVPVSVVSQASQPAIDLLYAPADKSYNKASGTVNLLFAHKLVKVVFNISNGQGISTPLTGLTVKVDGQLPNGTLNLTDGSVTASGTPGEITCLTNDAGTSSEAILLPAANNSGKFYFDNGTDAVFTANIPHAEWKAGNKYIYTVTLQRSEVTITGEITPWMTNSDNVIAN